MDRQVVIRTLLHEFRPAVPLRTFREIVYGVGKDVVNGPDLDVLRALLKEERTRAVRKIGHEKRIRTEHRRGQFRGDVVMMLHEELFCPLLEGLQIDLEAVEHLQAILVYGFLDRDKRDIHPLAGVVRTAVGRDIRETVEKKLGSAFVPTAFQKAFHSLVVQYEVLRPGTNGASRIYTLNTENTDICREEIGIVILQACQKFINDHHNR